MKTKTEKRESITDKACYLLTDLYEELGKRRVKHFMTVPSEPHSVGGPDGYGDLDAALAHMRLAIFHLTLSHDTFESAMFAERQAGKEGLAREEASRG